VLVVDDGSTDKTKSKIKEQISKIPRKNIKLYEQDHLGPAAARNLGASRAKGEILVFVDADMEFEPDFISKLIAPISTSRTIGTFSKEEYLLNKDNVWARCWNLNLGRKTDRMHSENYPDTQAVFRAILRSKFQETGGFDSKLGYTDDWSLARKLGTLATVAPGARYYHRNPDTLSEVWTQARWFGKNEFLTGDLVRKIYNIFRYDPLLSLLKGIVGAFLWRVPQYLIFKPVYDTAVFTSVVLSFLGEQKNK